jgi:hypothetical protein
MAILTDAGFPLQATTATCLEVSSRTIQHRNSSNIQQANRMGMEFERLEESLRLG